MTADVPHLNRCEGEEGWDGEALQVSMVSESRGREL